MPKKYNKKANPKNMKKTTRRGAYAPKQKKQMTIRRAPLVECKKDERFEWNGETGYNIGPGDVWPDYLQFHDLAIGDTAVGGNANHNISDIPETWLYRSQGFKQNEMVGDSVFIKYLKMKMEIKLPENDNLIHFPQCQMFLIHGFVKKTISANEFTTPTLTDITRENMVDIVSAQLDEYFNDSNEPLRFQPKGSINSPLKILGRQEIKWNKNKSILPDPVRTRQADLTIEQFGSLPTKTVSCEWPMMRKQKYVPAPALLNPNGTVGTRPANFFANEINPDEGIPFWCIYMPGGENIIYSVNANRIQYRYNEVCYYTDS